MFETKQEKQSLIHKSNKRATLVYQIFFGILGASIVIFVMVILGMVFAPVTYFIQQWYKPIPEGVEKIAEDLKFVYPLLDDIASLSRSTVRGNILFQFGYHEFNTTIDFANVLLDDQIEPMLYMVDGIVEGFTSFVNGVADFLNPFNIDFNLKFIDNLNEMNTILQLVPGQLDEMQVMLGKCVRSGSAIGQALDSIGMKFEKFHRSCDNITKLVDDVYVNVDSVIDGLHEVNDMIPVIVIVVKLVCVFLFAWVIFITIVFMWILKQKKKELEE